MKRFTMLMPILFFSRGMFAQSENVTPFIQSRNTTAKESSTNNSLKIINESTLLPGAITGMLIGRKQKNIQYIINLNQLNLMEESFMRQKSIATRYFYLAFIMLGIIILSTSSVLIAQEAEEVVKDTSWGFGDFVEFIIIVGYFGGVFILLPWVIYTNLKEGLTIISEGSTPPENSTLSEEERNGRAAKVLEEIDNRLTHYEEDGKDMVTITKGSQARFSRKGLAYIRNELVPANPDIITRANELIGVYQNRSERIFTGSKWIIGFAIGFGVFIAYIAGLNSFIFIHALGIVFYVLSSRTPIYILEKRMNRINNIGFGKSILTGLFIGSSATHYKVYSDGRKERDYSMELTGGFVTILIMVVIAMGLAVFTAFLGVVNFLTNYMNNALIPMKPETWYEKNFVAK